MRFFFRASPTTAISTLSLHDALPISGAGGDRLARVLRRRRGRPRGRLVHALLQQRDEILDRSEEHTSELQSHSDLVCRLLLEKKKDSEVHLPPLDQLPGLDIVISVSE